jgi:2,4-dienoyl-CoA reductase-like NADH-dependent reductase (Old Yellow Enzyme family)
MAPRLFTPISLRGLTLSNRIMVSPMCMYSAVDGMPQSWHRTHLGTLSLSGAGVMMLEATGVEARGRISLDCLGLYNDEQEEALALIVSDLKQNSGIAIGIQLGHSGRKGSRIMMMPRGSRPLTDSEGGWQGVAPSAIPYDDGWIVPEELDAAGLVMIREAFVESARRADRAGFDLIEVHGAHGYLMHAFRSPNSNRRTDAYGGTPEKRARFPLEVMQAMRAALDPDKPLGMRVNGADWHDDGVTLDDTVEFARALKDIGIDYVTTSGGAGSPKINPPPATPGYMVDFAEAVKAGSRIATIAVGMILDGRQAEAILADGRADIVAVGRGFLDDPRWAFRAAVALGHRLPYPTQYSKAEPTSWTGYRQVHRLPDKPG